MASSGATSAANTNAFNVTEALSKSTVRICCGVRGTNNVSIGTAFMVLFKQDQERHTSIPVFVTNKHVVRGSQYIQFALSEKGRVTLCPKKFLSCCRWVRARGNFIPMLMSIFAQCPSRQS